MFIQDKAEATFGTQWWKGARPNFTLSARRIRYNILVSIIDIDVRSLRSNIADLNAWTIKYLIADSVDEGEGLIIRSGMKEIKLYSSPVQTPIHEYEDTDKIEENIRLNTKKEEKGNFKVIKIWIELNYSIDG